MLSVSVCSCWAITCCANSSRRDVDQSPALSVPDLFVSFRCLLNKLASLRHSNLNKGLSTLRDVLAVVPETAPASLLVTSHLVYSAAATAAADRNNDGPAFDHAACCQNSKDAGAEVHQHQAWPRTPDSSIQQQMFLGQPHQGLEVDPFGHAFQSPGVGRCCALAPLKIPNC